MPSITSLLKASWRRYAASLNVFALIYVLYFVPMALVVAVMSSIYRMAPKPLNPLVLAWLVAGGVMALLVSVWGQAAFIYAASGRFRETKKLLKEALEKTASFAWVYVIFGLLVLAGMVFFIVPGIIALVWFSFSVYVLAIDGDKGIGAIIKSRQYVRGQWWPVFSRYLPVLLLYIALNLTPVLGPLLWMIFMPFLITYQCILFEEIKAAKGPVESPQAAQKKRWALACGLVIILAALLTASAFSGLSRTQLEQFTKDPAKALQQLNGKNLKSQI